MRAHNSDKNKSKHHVFSFTNIKFNSVLPQHSRSTDKAGFRLEANSLDTKPYSPQQWGKFSSSILFSYTQAGLNVEKPKGRISAQYSDSMISVVLATS